MFGTNGVPTMRTGAKSAAATTRSLVTGIDLIRSGEEFGFSRLADCSKTDRECGRNQEQTCVIKVHARSTDAQHFRSRGDGSLQSEPVHVGGSNDEAEAARFARLEKTSD
jgi:hypothetical protein